MFRSEYSCFNHDFLGYFVFFNAVLKGKPPVFIFCVFSVTSIVKCKMSQKTCFYQKMSILKVLHVFLVPKLHIRFVRKILYG